MICLQKKDIRCTYTENPSQYSFKKAREMATELLISGKFNINDFNKTFRVISGVNLSYYEKKFVCLETGIDSTEIASIYSKAKHGSIEDIKTLSEIVAKKFITEVEDNNSELSVAFKSYTEEESLVLITPGLRNVPSAANIIFKHALEKINTYLAENNYQTIINVNLPRLDKPVHNYASLSLCEREQISKTRDHVLPDESFYKNRKVHVFFGDDVLITGATNDKVIASALSHKAASFYSIFAVVIDPVICSINPEIEYALNYCEFGDNISNEFIDFMNLPEMTPVMKSFNIILDEKNLAELRQKICLFNKAALKKIYIAGLSNGFKSNPIFSKSLALLRDNIR